MIFSEFYCKVRKKQENCVNLHVSRQFGGTQKNRRKMKHYQEIVDEIFGNLYKHRTLRTLFDPNSSEWNETTIEKKLEILKKILESNKITLEQLISGYKNFYKNELANKEHVLNSLENGILILLQNSL